MAAKTRSKTTAKKAAPKKAAARKPAPKKAVIKGVVARRTTNRLAARPAGTGEPPTGPLNAAALEGAVKQWIAIPNKRSTDYCAYSQTRLAQDLKEMRAGVEDLPQFAAKKTPINARHFEWLDLLQDALTELGDEDVARRGDAEVLGEDGAVAVQRVKDARGKLSRRAEACGIPLALFVITRGEEAPAAVFNQGARAARMARQRLDQFNDRAYALSPVEELEAALDVLKVLVDGGQDLGGRGKDTNARRAALKRLAYDAMTVLAPWGRDVTAGDPTKAGRYDLDHIFQPRPKKAPKAPAPA